jgi:hypothetical protein
MFLAGMDPGKGPAEEDSRWHIYAGSIKGQFGKRKRFLPPTPKRQTWHN